MNIICNLCDSLIYISKRGNGKCTTCGLEYKYDEGPRPILSRAQWEVLLALHRKDFASIIEIILKRLLVKKEK